MPVNTGLSNTWLGPVNEDLQAVLLLNYGQTAIRACRSVRVNSVAHVAAGNHVHKYSRELLSRPSPPYLRNKKEGWDNIKDRPLVALHESQILAQAILPAGFPRG